MITKELIAKFRADYYAKPENQNLAAAMTKVGINDATIDHQIVKQHTFKFSDITKKGKITNQKSSGRCWMFAALNVGRLITMDKLNLENMEYSKVYTLFWDKMEKANYFYENIIATLDLSLKSREVAHLLTAPLQDGGQWAMFAGLLEKYGVVPQEIVPETFHSQNTYVLEKVLTTRLRKHAMDMRVAYQNGESVENLRIMKDQFLSEIFNILTKTLGEMPQTFTYEFYDKDKKFHRIKDITPVEFFNQYIGWNLKDKVSLINAPTPDKPYYKAFTIKYLGSVKEAEIIKHINLPIEVLKEAAIKSIQAGEPVWFGCDVGQMSNSKLGIMDYQLYRYNQSLADLGTFDKGQRLEYGESLLTHAMVFTGVNLDENGKPISWQVENSWGKDLGDEGIFSMSDQWFDEFNYQIMVDKKFVDEKYLKALEEEIIELEPWDPMGALA